MKKNKGQQSLIDSTLATCPICRKILPSDYIQCPECGTTNPHIENSRARKLEVLIDDALLRPVEAHARHEGKTVDLVVTEALEMFISSLADVPKKKT